MLKRDIFLSSEKGFILVTALIAIAILMALGLLALMSSTEELKTSVHSLGEKKALAAAESGYHVLTQTFDPLATNYGQPASTAWRNVDATNAPGAQYKVTNVDLNRNFPALPPPGFSMESAQGWGMARYDVTVTGQDTVYKTEQQVGMGIAYGPIDLSLVYR